MKKFAITVLIICGVLIILGIIITAISRPSFESIFRSNQSADIQNYTYSVGGQIKNVNIKSVQCVVRVVASDENVCKVEYTQADKLPVSVKEEADTLIIEQKDERRWFDFLFGMKFKDLKVCVYLPAGMYDKLNIESVSGSINVDEGMEYGYANLSTVSGKIELFSDVHGDINLVTTSGAVNLSHAESAERINISNTSGSISIENTVAKSDVNVKGTSGSVTVKSMSCQDLYIKNVSGRIKLEDIIADGTMKIDSVSGGIEFSYCDANEIYIDVTSGKVQGTLLSGKDFDVTSVSGKVSVPESTGDGKCKINTISGAIDIQIKSR